MPIDYEKVMSLKSEGIEASYTDRESILYALGVGFGRDPLDAKELSYTYEKDMKTVPTLPAVVGTAGLGIMIETGINFMLMVHGEQRLTIHKHMPPAANLKLNSRIAGAYDKGADKGALLVIESEGEDAATGEKYFTQGMTLFCRGDGGFGGPAEGAPEPHQLPDRDPDNSFEVETLKDQALLYRLSGDRNPLHCDPDFASAAGFPAPILHGLCTYGSVCRGILVNEFDYDNTKMKSFDARFSSPVFPGETIIIETWRDGNVLSFRARLKDRDAVVLNNGRCEFED